MFMRLRTLRRATVTLAASAIAAACLTAPAHAQSSTPDALISDPADPFYAAPAEVPQAPGTVIREQLAPHMLNLADPTARQLGLDEPQLPGRAHRMMYSSTDRDGRPVAVTGVVIEPSVPWTGAGPTPTLVMAAGTRGQGDACAPSKGPWLLGAIDPQHGAAGINYELPAMYAAAMRGMRVVMTDYMGLGTEGLHHYVHRTKQAHAVLDSARAGLALAGAPADSPVAFYGYSQGGGAAAAAAEEAAGYAPGLNVAGSYVGAPPAELTSVLGGVDGSTIAGVLGYAVNTGRDIAPAVDEAFDRQAAPQASAKLRRLADACIGDTALSWAFRSSAELIESGRPLSEVLEEEPAIREYLSEQALGLHPISAPMLVLSGRHDDVIPHAQARGMAVGYCAAGGTVDFRSDGLPELPHKTGLNHAIPVFSHAGPALDWVQDRFNGVPAASNCDALLAGGPEQVLGVPGVSS